MLPDSVTRAAELSGSKPVLVVKDGQEFKIDAASSPNKEAAESLADTIFRLQKLALIEMSEEIKQLRDSIANNTVAVESVIEDNKSLLKEIADLRETMMFPVIGKRENGQIVARRVKLNETKK